MYVLYLKYWNLERRNVIRCISEIINSIEFFITQMWKYHQFRESWLRIWFPIGFKNLKNRTILDKLLFCSDSLHIYKRFQAWLIQYYALRLTKLILGIKRNPTYAKSVRQNFTNLLRVVSLKTQSNTTISICNLGLATLPMRLPRCFESYCTPVDDLVLLNARFVDPHHACLLRRRRLLLIIIICISLLSKTRS